MTIIEAARRAQAGDWVRPVGWTNQALVWEAEDKKWMTVPTSSPWRNFARMPYPSEIMGKWEVVTPYQVNVVERNA